MPLLQPLTGKDGAESLCDHHSNLCFTDTSPTLLDVVSMNLKQGWSVSCRIRKWGRNVFYEETCAKYEKQTLNFSGYLFRER